MQHSHRSFPRSTFAPATHISAGTGPTDVAIDDLDHDGDNDLIVSTGGSEDVAVLRNKGDGTFEPAEVYGAGLFPQSTPFSLTTADFDQNDTAGPVAGSIIVQDRLLTFVATGSVLPTGTYTVVIRGGVGGVRDLAGDPLDGNGDGTFGDDHIAWFQIDLSTARELSVPEFARGPRQSIEVPATGEGLPIKLSDADGVLSVDFVFEYVPALMDVAGISVGPELPNDWSITANLGTPGHIVAAAFGTTALPPGVADIAMIEATVPEDAANGTAARPRLTNVAVNDGRSAEGGESTPAGYGAPPRNPRTPRLRLATTGVYRDRKSECRNRR